MLGGSRAGKLAKRVEHLGSRKLANIVNTPDRDGALRVGPMRFAKRDCNATDEADGDRARRRYRVLCCWTNFEAR